MRGVMMRVEESIMRNTPTFVAICVAALGLGSIASAQAPCRAVEIDRRGAEEAYVFDLNNWGQVVGALATTPEGQVSHIQPFVWENGRTRLLEAPSQVSEARAINAFGRVVGTLYEADSQVRPVTWTRGRITRLASVPQALAVDVNNRGQIVGYNSMSRGVLWQSADSEPVDLGTLGGGMAQPAAINDHGVIVGVSATLDNALHGFVWQDGVLTDIGLPDHPDAAIDIVRTELAGINDDGLAVGYAYAADGTTYPLLWTRAQGARILPDAGSAAAVNSWGTVVVVSPNNDLLLGSYGRPFRTKGRFEGTVQLPYIELNDRYQLAYSELREGKWVGRFCQLTL
jgi:probable HAF family extracellular repeat protein